MAGEPEASMTTTTRPRTVAIRLAEFLPYRFGALGHRLTLSEAELRAGPVPITLPEWKVLAIVADRGPVMPVEICRLGTQPKASVSRLVARLLEIGLIARRPRAGDGRTFELSLTAKGRRVYGGLAPRARRLEARIDEALSPRERVELERLIAKIERSLTKEGRPSPT
jgi:DNA-binding MarR family transcriptional regulator